MHQTNHRGHNETSTATTQNQLAYKACRQAHHTIQDQRRRGGVTPLANPDEAFGRQYRQQVDGAVTDHGDAAALVHAAGQGGAVAGAEDVRDSAGTA